MRTRYASLIALATFGGSSCNLVVGAGDYKVGHTGTGGASATTSTGAAGPGTTASSATGTNSSSSGMSGLAVSPMTTSLLASAGFRFTATNNGSPATGVTWKVDEANGGTVDANGTYLAPASAGTFHVRATSSGDGSFAEATVNVATSASAVDIAPGGGINVPSGFGFESHLAYAAGPGEWWLFYDEGAGGAHILTMHSKTFSAWQMGESAVLSQGHSGDGRDLDVASKQMGGHDVVHITQGTSNFGRYHIRAALSDGHVAFDPPAVVNSGGDTHPDGSGTAILDDGTVIDSTGWQPTPQTPPLSPCGNGDVDIFIANAKEDGMTSFGGVGFGEQVIWCVGSHVNARKLIPLGQTLVAMYEDGQSDPTPVNILTSIRQMDGTWLPLQNPAGSKVTPPSAFATDQTFGLDDWNAAPIGTTMHAVRRLGSFFDHTQLPSGGVWSNGAAIPPKASDGDSGLFLAPYGVGLVLVDIGSAPGSPLNYTVFNGTSWSDWAELVPANHQRSYISGFAPEKGAKPAIIWVEDGNIRGALLP